jgi:hypothetical protein
LNVEEFGIFFKLKIDRSVPEEDLSRSDIIAERTVGGCTPWACGRVGDIYLCILRSGGG